MGRTRPLLQQIIMGVKINLAKWSDALLETSNCFSLILRPPPRSLRAVNDAAVGAGVSPGEEGLGGGPPEASALSGPRAALRGGLSRGSHTSSRAPALAGRPTPALCSTRHQPSFFRNIEPGEAWRNRWGRRGGPLSLHLEPLCCLRCWGAPAPNLAGTKTRRCGQ